MRELFLHQRKCAGVDATYYLWPEDTYVAATIFALIEIDSTISYKGWLAVVACDSPGDFPTLSKKSGLLSALSSRPRRRRRRRRHLHRRRLSHSVHWRTTMGQVGQYCAQLCIKMCAFLHNHGPGGAVVFAQLYRLPRLSATRMHRRSATHLLH